MEQNYDIEADAQTIRDATDIVGTNMDKLTDILCCRPPAHIKALREHFEKDHLMHRIKVETSGLSQFALENILREDHGRRREFVNAAVSGAGTDEKLLMDCILSATEEQIHDVKKSWEKGYFIPMIARLMMDGILLGGFHSLLEQALAENKPESGIMEDKIENDIEVLFKATEGKLGTDEMAVVNICNTRSREHLLKLNEEYKKRSKKGKSFIEIIKKETSGTLEDALICCFTKPTEWHAMRIHNAMKGLGTKEKQLIISLLLPSTKELKEISNIMMAKYNEDLEARVKSELSGDLEKIMLKYVQYHLKH